MLQVHTYMYIHILQIFFLDIILCDLQNDLHLNHTYIFHFEVMSWLFRSADIGHSAKPWSIHEAVGFPWGFLVDPNGDF